MQDTINSANEAASVLFLGHDGEWWDFWLILSVVFAALAAVAIGITTTGSIVSHKREAAAAESALEKYKVDAKADADVKIDAARTEAKVALEKASNESAERIRGVEEKARVDVAKANESAEQAKAAAAEANLALARLKTPRTIPTAEYPRLVGELSKFEGTKVAIYILGEGPEPNGLAGIISALLKQSQWEPLSWNWTGVGATTGVVVLIKEGTEGQVGAASDALVAAFASVNLDTGKQTWPGDWEHFGGMLNGPNPPDPTAAPIRIVVGTKPQ